MTMTITSIDTLSPTSTIAHYKLQRLLARGGMSVVYLAQDMRTQHTVAIKLVHSDEQDYCTRFKREVKVTAKLHHDNILPSFDYGEQDGWCYMVMPYIEGGTLRQLVEQHGQLSPREAGKLFMQLADAVQFAHEHGVLHRDLKPSNVLLRDSQHVYLTDFGLVRQIEEDSNITSTGYIIGTPEYMAPEQVERPATPSSEVYALGIVLYQMLTGNVPFKGSTPVGTCWKHMYEQPTPPSTLNPEISAGVEAVLLRALAKDPEQRFQSVREFARAFQHALQGESGAFSKTAVHRVHTTSRSRTRFVHSGMVATAVLLLLFIMPATLGFMLSRTYGSQWYKHIPMLLGSSGSFFVGQGGRPGHPILPSTPTATPQPATGNGRTPSPSSNTLNRYTTPPTPTRTTHSGTSQSHGNSNSRNTSGRPGQQRQQGGQSKSSVNSGGQSKSNVNSGGKSGNIGNGKSSSKGNGGNDGNSGKGNDN